MTKNQKEFQKEVNRLQRSIAKLTKQPQFQQTIDLPTQPPKVTKSYLSQLKQLKGKDFLTEIDLDTGEILTTPKLEEAYRSKKKPSTPEEYIPRFDVYNAIRDIFVQALEEIEIQQSEQGYFSYTKELLSMKHSYVSQLLQWLDDNYNEKGGVYIAYLKQHEEELAEHLHTVVYDSDQYVVERSLTRLAILIRQDVGYTQERQKEFEWHLGMEYTDETYFNEVYK